MRRWVWVLDKIKVSITDYLQDNPQKSVKDVTVACYGLAFKPDIDDLRESPAMSITESLAKLHAGKVVAVEPNIEIDEDFPDIELMTFGEAKKLADVHVLLVDHKEFQAESFKSNYLVDTKGIWK